MRPPTSSEAAREARARELTAARTNARSAFDELSQRISLESDPDRLNLLAAAIRTWL